MTMGTMIPARAMTARGPRKPKREALALLQYALEYGAEVVVTDPAVCAALATRGLPTHRLPNAASDLRKFYGVRVENLRDGRKTRAYLVDLSTVSPAPSAESSTQEPV